MRLWCAFQITKLFSFFSEWEVPFFFFDFPFLPVLFFSTKPISSIPSNSEYLAEFSYDFEMGFQLEKIRPKTKDMDFSIVSWIIAATSWLLSEFLLFSCNVGALRGKRCSSRRNPRSFECNIDNIIFACQICGAVPLRLSTSSSATTCMIIIFGVTNRDTIEE